MYGYVVANATVAKERLTLVLRECAVALEVALTPQDGVLVDPGLAERLHGGEQLLIEGRNGSEPAQLLGIDSVQRIYVRRGEEAIYDPLFVSTLDLRDPTP